MSEGKDDPVEKVRFSTEISLGQVIQAIVVAGGFAWAVMIYMGRVDSTERRQIDAEHSMSQMRVDVTSQLSAQKVDTTTQIAGIALSMNDQFKSLRLDIANLPDVRAELTQLGKRVDQWDNRAGAQSERMNRLETMVIQSNARYERANPHPEGK